MAVYVIYKTTNLVNGKIYIGKDAKNRSTYFGSGTILKQAIKKYGVENFKKEILEVCENLKVLAEKEIYWIEKFDARNSSIGYNIAKGGNGGDPDLCSKNIKKWWDNMTPEERFDLVSKKHKKYYETASEHDKKNRTVAAIKARSYESRRQTAIDNFVSMSPEKRSASSKKGWANLTPEQRSERAKLIWKNKNKS